ncbi:anchored repeat ABC transporter, substrate-binding protein [Boudabousia marimammalium]|uniref:Anchored repeat ABC transporter, substrate-binding protein n=1 Tax=Boudabousia marimammalium TaxID=156892 RepID=A0A1Q5PS86_9ACTO|nr:anchored repeat ABC transporter, substrate-binding protein [Boudabousia marimammalium]OKL50448.1 anchored repeat ABC transporter, substrate-binding protein [Boudabousia marimammalium]
MGHSKARGKDRRLELTMQSRSRNVRSRTPKPTMQSRSRNIRNRTPKLTALSLVLGASLTLSACTPSAPAIDPTRTNPDGTHHVQVVASTGIIADLARNVAGDRATVTPLVPEGADPHSYEPTLRDIRSIVYADAAFTNYVMLEEHSLIKAIDANLPETSENVALAEDAARYSAEIIPLVEDASLDTIWLGLRVRGNGKAYGANRSSEATIKATGMRGPGILAGYLTGSFGKPDIYFNSGDGIDPTDDSVALPLDAHTHVSWAFDKPGIYQLDLQATLNPDQNASNTVGSGSKRAIPSGETTLTFAVGVDPHSLPGADQKQILDAGHADITADIDTGKFSLFADPKGGGEYTQKDIDPANAIIEVPSKALQAIPPGPEFRFLGKAGQQIYLLPQAVLGKHVHGEIDPHLWHDVRNAKAYVKSIRDTLSKIDPQGAHIYAQNTANYLAKLDATDAFVRKTIHEVPPAKRTLVTTHDAYGYLAHAYGLKVVGFITPNPGTEPSVAQRVKLARTMADLGVKAVFAEPYLATRNQELQQVAHDAGAAVCPIYSDSFDPTVNTYIDMMRFNATSIRTCLGDAQPWTGPEPTPEHSHGHSHGDSGAHMEGAEDEDAHQHTDGHSATPDHGHSDTHQH